MKLKNAVALFEITNACNMSCKHCYREELGGVQLKTNEVRIVLEKIITGGVTSLILSGGEPLLRNDIFDIIDYAGDCGIENIVINTNGLLLNDSKIIQGISRRLDLISDLPVSFDGARSETHDFIRGEGQFTNLMKTLENELLDNFPIGLNVTLGKWNYEDFDQFFVLYDELDPIDINFGIFIPLGQGTQLLDQVLTPSQCGILIERSKAKRDEGYTVDLCSLPYANLTVMGFSGACCNIFSEFITITAKGNIVPCVLYDFNCGSLLEKELEDILSQPLSKTFRNPKKLKKSMRGYCQTCADFKRCKGGCHLLTYALEKTIFNSDPLCPLQIRKES